ncbi:hypothetical protein [Paucisalibacillus globulus]|uniref:hypothetical protein n=1 Tax=Paucisalibacillus globulus TaxID=351095 RepID=UPI00040264D1|nr:hypothetical protein [Paucisalibacillus globulus]
MVSRNKRVVLLIVEGDCEETLLYDRLRDVYKQHEIRFDVQRGDIFFSFENSRTPIKNIVGDRVRQYLKERKFKESDIVSVLHIVDTDGCFISNNKVCVNESQTESTFYYLDKISVNSEIQKQHIIQRNEKRSRNIRTMYTANSILNGKIPYRVYYFSRHLEHVIFNDPNPIGATKLEKVEEYIDCLQNPIEEELKKYMPDLEGSSLEELYIESWNKIIINETSLNRGTNVPLLFDFIAINP